MRYLPASLSFIALPIATITLGLTPDRAAIAQAQPNTEIATQCRYNPDSGKPNPLGMRAFVTLAETIGGDTSVILDLFPSNLSGSVPATIAQKRTLFFPKRSIAQVRQLLLKDPSYYNELLASKSASFTALNGLLLCKGTTPTSEAPKPNGRPETMSIAQLSDGAYRVWNGTPTKAVMSNDDLLQSGGVIVLLNKKGNQITAGFGYIDSDVTACVSGRVNGNVITGQAFPYSRQAPNLGKDFTNFGPANFLRVRNPKTIAGQPAYSEAILDLSDFSRINLGSRSPQKSCP